MHLDGRQAYLWMAEYPRLDAGQEMSDLQTMMNVLIIDDFIWMIFI